jgi:hypothetical protein
MKVFVRPRAMKSTRCVQFVRLLSALALSLCLIFNYKLLSADEQETGIAVSVYSLRKENGREESYQMRTHSKVQIQQIQQTRSKKEQPVIVNTNSRAVG